jgi:3-hydroxyacyl-[acyl-carrier-protein] dehydratase
MNATVDYMDEIMRMIPYKEPFKFIDEITYVDENRIEGNYLFNPESAFYRGHFPGYPLTPGVILIEVMAQIGLVAFGLYLLNSAQETFSVGEDKIPVLASADVNFRKRVLPGEMTYVISEKVVFKHKMLICKVKLLNSSKSLIAQGTISGFIASKD